MIAYPSPFGVVRISCPLIEGLETIFAQDLHEDWGIKGSFEESQILKFEPKPFGLGERWRNHNTAVPPSSLRDRASVDGMTGWRGSVACLEHVRESVIKGNIPRRVGWPAAVGKSYISAATTQSVFTKPSNNQESWADPTTASTRVGTTDSSSHPAGPSEDFRETCQGKCG